MHLWHPGYKAKIYRKSPMNIVNIDLLMKTLRKVGLPEDVVGLIEIWLSEQYFYVSFDGVESLIMISGGIFR